MSNAMSYSGFRRTLKLLRRWNFQCIICGRPFDNAACVTIEHIIPRAGGGTGCQDNLAPSHFRCNQMKGELSLALAAHAVKRMENRWSAKRFHDWLNARVPHRQVPWYALLPVDTEWFNF